MAAGEAYTDKKWNQNGTGDARKAADLEYLPVVVESYGGWTKTTADVVNTIAASVSARTSEAFRSVSRQMAWRMSVIIQRHMAQAIRKRDGSTDEVTTGRNAARRVLSSTHADRVGRAADIAD